MRLQRVVLTAAAAGALVIAGGCRSARTSSTTTTTDNGTYSSTSSSTTVAEPMAMPMTTTTTTPTTTAAVGTTTTDANGATTTVIPNGTITKSSSTTVVYPDGTVKTVNGDNGMTSSTGTTTTAVAGAPGTVTTRTVTTITTKTTAPPSTTVVQTVPAYVQPPPMTSSTTTIYQPAQPQRVFYRNRRYPNLDFLVFADRASFSTNNRSLDGTVNTGALGTDIRNENGYGLGLNWYWGSHFSTEFTASRIRPKATLTPENAGVNPITGLRLKMTPYTGTLQAHFNPWSSVDLNIGGGAAYVTFKADNSFNPGNSGLTGVTFRDEWGPLVNAGLAFNMSRNFGIRFDAKYMWVRARATTTFDNGVGVVGNVGNTEHLGLNPFILSAGLRFGF